MMNLEQKIEAVLFYKNEPVKIKKLAEILAVSESEVKESLDRLSASLESRGICLIQSESEAGLATSAAAKDLIEGLAKDEMSRDIGKAGLETLAIILYNGPVSRREIDYIRGVNSTFILRNLSMRGLIEKEADSKDQRVLRYKSSLSLLAHLGLKRAEELPEFDALRKNVNESLEPKVQKDAE